MRSVENISQDGQVSGQDEAGFAGTPQAWARMHAIAQATGDTARAWVEVFTSSNSSSSATEDVQIRWAA